MRILPENGLWFWSLDVKMDKSTPADGLNKKFFTQFFFSNESPRDTVFSWAGVSLFFRESELLEKSLVCIRED